MKTVYFDKNNCSGNNMYSTYVEQIVLNTLSRPRRYVSISTMYRTI